MEERIKLLEREVELLEKIIRLRAELGAGLSSPLPNPAYPQPIYHQDTATWNSWMALPKSWEIWNG